MQGKARLARPKEHGGDVGRRVHAVTASSEQPAEPAALAIGCAPLEGKQSR